MALSIQGLPASSPVMSRWNLAARTGDIMSAKALLCISIGNQLCSREHILLLPPPYMAPSYRTQKREGQKPPQHPVSRILVTFQNINLLLIKGCLNPGKLKICQHSSNLRGKQQTVKTCWWKSKKHEENKMQWDFSSLTEKDSKREERFMTAPLAGLPSCF